MNLKNLQHLKNRMFIQNPIKLDRIDTTFYHTTIPFYGIAVGTAALILIIIVRRHLGWKKANTAPPEEETREDEEHTYV